MFTLDIFIIFILYMQVARNKEDRMIDPDTFPNVNESVINELNHLFESVSPTDLRKSLHQVLFRYLIQSYDIQRNDFQKIMQDIYMLTEFLQRTEELMNSEKDKI